MPPINITLATPIPNFKSFMILTLKNLVNTVLGLGLVFAVLAMIGLVLGLGREDKIAH